MCITVVLQNPMGDSTGLTLDCGVASKTLRHKFQ